MVQEKLVNKMSICCRNTKANELKKIISSRYNQPGAKQLMLRIETGYFNQSVSGTNSRIGITSDFKVSVPGIKPQIRFSLFVFVFFFIL